MKYVYAVGYFFNGSYDMNLLRVFGSEKNAKIAVVKYRADDPKSAHLYYYKKVIVE